MRRVSVPLVGLALLAVLALLAIGGLWRKTEDAPRPSPPIAADTISTRPDAAAPLPAPSDVPSAPRAAPDTAAVAPATVRGVVLDPEGVPVPNASVHVARALAPAPGGDLYGMFAEALAGAAIVAQTSTDPAGRFAFSADLELAPGLELVVAAPRLAEGRWPLTGAGPWRLVLMRGASLTGWVEDHAGRRVADARLSLLAFDFATLRPEQVLRTRSAADGSFALRAPPRPEGWVLWAEDEDGGTAALDHIQPPQTAVRLVLPAPGSLRGRITLGPRGRGLQADLLLLGPAGARATSTDEQGSFALPVLSAGVWQLSVRSPDRTLQTSVQVTAGRETVFDLRLEQAASLELRLVAASTGAPVAEAPVAVVSRAGAGMSRQDGLTDPQGRVLLQRLAPGAFAVHVQSPGFGPQVIPGETPLQAGEQRSLEASLQAAATLAGVLLDGRHQPLAGVRVRWHDVGWEGLDIALPSSEPSAADGRFLLRGLASGQELELALEGHPQRLHVDPLEPGEHREDVIFRVLRDP